MKSLLLATVLACSAVAAHANESTWYFAVGTYLQNGDWIPTGCKAATGYPASYAAQLRQRGYIIQDKTDRNKIDPNDSNVEWVVTDPKGAVDGILFTQDKSDCETTLQIVGHSMPWQLRLLIENSGLK